ncbi:hypothetical protein KJ853_03945 [Patescibacteria group bacterium]|nr:hypothetical protein [Patescibacteria group bacterium]
MEEKIKKADNLIRQGKSSLAVSIIKDALKEAPEHPYLYYLLGIARMKCVRFFLAKRALEKADRLLPHNAENLRSLGWVKVMSGQLEEGRKDLREAINLGLIDPLPYIDLAMSYFHHFDFKEGNECLARAHSLAPEDPYVLNNVKMAKEMERDFLKYSEKERQKIKKEKLNPEAQKFFRVSALQDYYAGKPLTRDEAEEVREEARLSGASAAVVNEKQERKIIASKNKSENSQRREILKKCKEIEKELSQMLKEINSIFGIEHIKDIIYHEKDDDDLMKIVSIFDRGGSTEELGQILEIVNDAWNYFPHKSLGGLCPMDKILEHRDGQKK